MKQGPSWWYRIEVRGWWQGVFDAGWRTLDTVPRYELAKLLYESMVRESIAGPPLDTELRIKTCDAPKETEA